MYDDILTLITEKKSILFVDCNKMNLSSHILQMLLSGYSLSELTIVDTSYAINFIQRNLKIDFSIDLLPYGNTKELIETAINDTNNNDNQTLFVCHYSNMNKGLESIKNNFEVVIWVFDKEDYKITNNKENIISYQYM